MSATPRLPVLPPLLCLLELSIICNFRIFAFCHFRISCTFPDEGNHALQEFLAARNPKQQHSSTLESYLIKPIQRILKYPLLLQQMRNLTDTRADEHIHLCGK